MKLNFHATPEEKLAHTSAASVAAIATTAKNVEATTKAIKDLHSLVKDKSIEATGFTGLLKAGKTTNDTLTEIQVQSPKVVQKLEEIKSAALVTNLLLKQIRDKEEKEFPEIPAADFTTTNKLIAQLIEEQKKEVTVTLTLV